MTQFLEPPDDVDWSPFVIYRCVVNIGFTPRELRGIERIVLDHRQEFVEAWDAYFGT